MNCNGCIAQVIVYAAAGSRDEAHVTQKAIDHCATLRAAGVCQVMLDQAPRMVLLDVPNGREVTP
jgi:hypothetical protein